MIEKFYNLEKEKQDRMINAAIKEFAHKGYDHASTNEIVKEAGISKGLLFHYFTSKKGLYLFLFDYAVELLTKEFYEKVDLQEPDFFIRIRQAIQIKMGIIAQFPDIFKFAERAYMEESSAVRAEVDHRIKELTGVNLAKIYEGIDLSRFRKDLDIAKIVKMMTWTFERLGDEAVMKAKLSGSHEIDYGQVVAEVNEYIELFKTCFYNREAEA